MKITKNKFLKPIIALSAITTVCIPLSCMAFNSQTNATNNQTNDAVVNDSNVGINLESQENRIEKTKVEYAIPEGTLGKDVKINGKEESFIIEDAVEGRQIGSIAAPTTEKYGCKFKYWEYVAPSERAGQEVKSTDTIIPGIVINPVFDDPLVLSSSVGFAVIETTEITINRIGGCNANLQYTLNYGEEWIDVPLAPNEGEDYSFKIDKTFYPGDNVFFRGWNDGQDNRQLGFSQSDTSYINFSFSEGSQCNIIGNIMGLVDKANPDHPNAIPNDYCFYKLFAGADAIQYVCDAFFSDSETSSGNAILTLKPHCYESLFEECHNLICGPWLPTNWNDQKDDVPTECYKHLFYNCSRLNSMKLGYLGSLEEYSATCFTDWLYGVSTSGEILFDGTVPSARTASTIPSEWKIMNNFEEGDVIRVSCDAIGGLGGKAVVDHPYQFKATTPEGKPEEVTWVSSNPNIAEVNPTTGVVTPIKKVDKGEVTITAISRYSPEWTGSKTIFVEDIDPDNCTIFTNKNTTGTSTISWEYEGDIDPQKPEINLKYSFDGIYWFKWWSGSTGTITLYNKDKPDEGQYTKVYVKGNNPDGLVINPDIGKESYYTHFTITGNVEASGTVMGLIDDATSQIRTIPCNYCFNHLFYDDDGLTSVSQSFLSDTHIEEEHCNGIYFSMFDNCDNLTNMNHTELGFSIDDYMGDHCCTQMFWYCRKLITPPKMPAGHVGPYCCQRMFEFDNNMTETPELFATEAAPYCYYMMFQQDDGTVASKSIGQIHLTSLADYCCYQTWYDIGGFSTSKGTKQHLVFKCPSYGDSTNPVTNMFASYYGPNKGYSYYHK